MGEGIGNLTSREYLSGGCIFLTILLGLGTLLIKPADPTLASSTPTPRNLQVTRGATATKWTNAPRTGCIGARPSSFTTVEADYYWSSTTLDGQERAYFPDIDHGHLLNGSFPTTLRVRPVRGGQR